MPISGPKSISNLNAGFLASGKSVASMMRPSRVSIFSKSSKVMVLIVVNCIALCLKLSFFGCVEQYIYCFIPQITSAIGAKNAGGGLIVIERYLQISGLIKPT